MGDRLRYGLCGASLEECAWAWEWNATAAMRHRQGYMGIMRRGNSAYACLLYTSDAADEL